MGKKPQHKQQKYQREPAEQQVLLAPRNATLTPMSQPYDPAPTKQEIERRKKLYFSVAKRYNPPSKAELYYFYDLVTNEFIYHVFESFEQLKTTKDYTPTYELKPVFDAALVKRVLRAGFFLLAQELNCIYLTVPGIAQSEYDELLTDMRKSYNITQQIGEVYELPANKNSPKHAKKLIVVGDTHGTFEVLQIIMRPENLNPDTVFLFNGDYVDRGSFSIEIITLLLLMKLSGRYVHMLRGNHEISSVCYNYSFYRELEKKYEQDAAVMFDLAVQLFYALPLAATINDTWFVVHGGLSGWQDFDIFEINKINRFRDPESDLFHHFHAFDPLNDLLWADPSEDVKMIAFNDYRGASVKFGENAVRYFLKKTNLSYLLRSHTCVQNGYDIMHSGTTYTLFSVPKYNQENLGAYVTMYGVYDENARPSEAQKRIYGDACTAYDCYLKNPTHPRVFIKQFTCSDNSSILNYPLIAEMSYNLLMQNLQMIEQRFGSLENFQSMMMAQRAQ